MQERSAAATGAGACANVILCSQQHIMTATTIDRGHLEYSSVADGTADATATCYVTAHRASSASPALRWL